MREDDSALRAGRGLAFGDELSGTGAGFVDDWREEGPATEGPVASATVVFSWMGCGSSVTTVGRADGGREGDVDSGVLCSDADAERELGPDRAPSDDGELVWFPFA